MRFKFSTISALVFFVLFSIVSAIRIKEIGGKFTPHYHTYSGLDLRYDAYRHAHRKLGKRSPIQELATAASLSSSSSSVLFKRTVKPEASTATPFNNTAYDAAAAQACAKAVMKRAEVVNPTGLTACYNIASWNSSSGVFEADIRLYRVSPSFGAFTNITTLSDYMMYVQIPEATLSSPQVTFPGGNAPGGAGTKDPLAEGFQSVGQLSSKLKWSTLTEQDLRVLLIPNITMAAVAPSTNRMISTTLSSDTISYVAGQLVQPGGAPTNITVPEAKVLSTAILKTATKFVYPGTYIKVFPVGLILTCSWSVILMSAVLLGTFGRYKFKQSYRTEMQQSATAMKSGFGKY